MSYVDQIVMIVCLIAVVFVLGMLAGEAIKCVDIDAVEASNDLL